VIREDQVAVAAIELVKATRSAPARSRRERSSLGALDLISPSDERRRNL
jgi:hypothetical protein